MILFVILLMFFTVNLQANEAGGIFTAEKEVKKILKTASPSIVKVVCEGGKKHYATGIAIDGNHVISNSIIVRYPCENIYVKTVDGKKIQAEVVGKDKESSIILLKIHKDTLPPIKWAGSYEVGDWAALVGAFYNQFPSIFQGIVSSMSDEEMILNAPAVPGSSGGAVLNKKGELMGVIRGRLGFASSPDYTYKDHSGEFLIKSSRSRGKDLCVAVPVKKVVGITRDLKKFGKVKRGWLGVTIDLAGDNKVEVTDVTKDSPANKAGIRKGDVILKVGEVPIKEPIHVTKAIRSLKPGQKVKIECLRGKERETALVVIGELKDERSIWKIKLSPETVIPELPTSLPNIENYIFRFVSSRTLGVEIMPLTPELAKAFNIKEGAGLMISKVYEDTAAEKAGLRPADIIVKAGSKAVKKNVDLRRALKGLKDKEPIVLAVYRKGNLKKIKLLPDKNKKFGPTLERLQEKLKNINITVEAENKLKAAEVEQLRKEEQKLREIREKYLKEAESARKKEIEKYKQAVEQLNKERETVRRKEIDRYKEAVEAMKKEQEKMKEEMEKMKLLLEKEKEEKEKEKNEPAAI